MYMYGFDTILYPKPMHVQQNYYWQEIRAKYDMLDLQTKCCPRPLASAAFCLQVQYIMLPSSPVNNIYPVDTACADTYTFEVGFDFCRFCEVMLYHLLLVHTIFLTSMLITSDYRYSKAGSDSEQRSKLFYLRTNVKYKRTDAHNWT